MSLFLIEAYSTSEARLHLSCNFFYISSIVRFFNNLGCKLKLFEAVVPQWTTHLDQLPMIHHTELASECYEI